MSDMDVSRDLSDSVRQIEELKHESKLLNLQLEIQLLEWQINTTMRLLDEVHQAIISTSMGQVPVPHLQVISTPYWQQNVSLNNKIQQKEILTTAGKKSEPVNVEASVQWWDEFLTQRPKIVRMDEISDVNNQSTESIKQSRTSLRQQPTMTLAHR